MKKSRKKDPGQQPDPVIAREIRLRIKKEALPCAVAFEISRTLGVEPHAVGLTADSMGVSLSKCQLGLFGYSPNKKIVAPRSPDNEAVSRAIFQWLVNDRLPCVAAWSIAAEFSLSKLAVANACEALGVKIKPCQLGAF